MSDKKITVEASIDATIDKAWKLWTSPEHIIKWNSPSDDWHTPKAENDLKKVGGLSTVWKQKMEALGLILAGRTMKFKTKKN